jgi:hypothetical protein
VVHFITGFDWMLSCTTEFEPTVAFAREVLGLPITEQGVAQVDTRFSRYARAALPNGSTLEIVEPAQSAEPLRGRQILCLTVRNILEAKQELERRGAVFASEMIDDGQGLGWIYLQAPGGNVYQVYGPIGNC